MKKCLVLLAILLSGVVNLTAQSRADVSLNGSILSMSNVTHNGVTRKGDLTGGVLASFRFWVTSRNGVEFDYGHATDMQRVTGNGSRFSLDSGVHEISGLYLFRLKASQRFQPFLAVGATLLQFNPAHSSTFGSLPRSQNKPGIVYTAGTDYMFSNTSVHGFSFDDWSSRSLATWSRPSGPTQHTICLNPRLNLTITSERFQYPSRFRYPDCDQFLNRSSPKESKCNAN